MCDTGICLLLEPAVAQLSHSQPSTFYLIFFFFLWQCLAWGSLRYKEYNAFYAKNKNCSVIFLEQIGFVLRTCELFDSSKNIKTTQSREKFIMAHLALRISLLVCVGKYSLSSCYLELENIYVFIFMCIDTDI